MPLDEFSAQLNIDESLAFAFASAPQTLNYSSNIHFSNHSSNIWSNISFCCTRKYKLFNPPLKVWVWEYRNQGLSKISIKNVVACLSNSKDSNEVVEMSFREVAVCSHFLLNSFKFNASSTFVTLCWSFGSKNSKLSRSWSKPQQPSSPCCFIQSSSSGRQGPKRQLFGLIHNFFPPPHTLPSFSEIQRICFRFCPRIGLFIVWPQWECSLTSREHYRLATRPPNNTLLWTVLL